VLAALETITGVKPSAILAIGGMQAWSAERGLRIAPVGYGGT